MQSFGSTRVYKAIWWVVGKVKVYQVDFARVPNQAAKNIKA